MIDSIKSKWWLFTILSGICMYLNPYFDLFSIFMIVVLFFDIIMFTIMKGHFYLFFKKIADKTEHTKIIKKIFNTEILFLKIGKLFTTIVMIFVILVVVKQNLDTKKIMAPYYIPVIQTNFFLQITCIILSVILIVFSFILFCFYADSYKQKLNELV